MSYQSEAELEQQFIQKLTKQGYEEIKVKDHDELVINLRKQLNLFNWDNLIGKEFSDKEFERVMNHLYGKSVFQSAKNLRDKFLLVRDDNSEIYIGFLDGKNFKNNIYQVSSQTTVIGKYKNRYDVTLIINGLPLVQIELKRRGMDIKEAFNQIERYRKHSYDKLYKFIQIFIISNGVDTKYFANSDKSLMYSLTFFWADEENTRITNLQDFTTAFLDKCQLSKMISKYTIINDTDKIQIIMRPYQVFATEALVKRAVETSNNGFVWHTTGAGKTLTSWMCSNLLVSEPSIKKVFFLVDRKDLDTQTTAEFNKFDANSVDTTSNTGVLVKQIADKSKKLIVTTIQKMSKATKNPKYHKVLDLYKDEKVIFIIDECHRSQFGDMHKDIKKYFTKAQYFGFTGTPIFKENMSQDKRTTADIFEKCLHTYLIKEAIHDNNVLGFSVEYIKTFEGQYDKDDDTLVSAIDTNEVFMSDERTSLVANHIVQHHNLKTRNRQYTSIFTVSSIPALIKYYDEFKTIDHNFKISAIFSYGANEDAEGKDEHSRDALERIIKDYNKLYGTNYSTDTLSAYNTDISKRVKTAQLDILIVVRMYLTGFDSRPLNTLYVDKNLMYHDLLQAFSRTNRVEMSTKPYGNIVCYRNIKNRTDEAIKLFSKTDNVDDVLMKDYEHYLDKFKDMVSNLYTVAETPASVDKLVSEEDKKKFVITFRELSKQLLVLQTFVDFEFDESQLGIKEQTYQDFKSKYFLIYDYVKRAENDKVSILNDIDFSIELMETDKINVAYIMNLLRSIDFSNKERKEKDIAHVREELERTDNPELRRKVELLKSFLMEVAPHITENDSVDDAFSNFESKQRTEDIKSFSKDNNVDFELIKNEISEYEFTGIISKDNIRDKVENSLPLIFKTKLINRIKDFIKEHVEKYQ